MKNWPEMKNSKLFNTIFTDEKELEQNKQNFKKVYNNIIDTWDFQWKFACIINKGLSIIPSKNLISNIGFDKKATHTTTKSNLANIPKKELSFPIKHPEGFITKIDDQTLEELIKRRKKVNMKSMMHKIKRTKEMIYKNGLFYTLKHAIKNIYKIILERKIERICYRYYKFKRRNKNFIFQGEKYPYFLHLYNLTWKNERAIEIPIITARTPRFVFGLASQPARRTDQVIETINE